MLRALIKNTCEERVRIRIVLSAIQNGEAVRNKKSTGRTQAQIANHIIAFPTCSPKSGRVVVAATPRIPPACAC